MKRILIVSILLVTVTSFAQKNFQGKAIYMSKTTVDMNAWGNQMSEQRKKQIKARMKNFLEKTYILDFTQSESTFKEDAKLEAPGGAGRRGFGFGGSSNGSTYKNSKQGEMIEAIEFFGKRFLIKEKMNQPKWELGTETKKIGEYVCYKATMTIVNNDFDWTVFRRNRNNSKKDSTNTEKKEKVRTKFVTAWYTPQIPVSNGPAEFWGLPGLILEITSGRTTMLCTELVINPAEKVAIKSPVKGKEVTREEYNKIVKEKTAEMRDRFRGRGRGRGRGRS
ncbi:MAG: GLPGLI family protein [Flavobacteriaceae bacterium]